MCVCVCVCVCVCTYIHTCVCACVINVESIIKIEGGRKGEERTEWGGDEEVRHTWGSASNSFTRVWSGGSTLRYLFFGALQGRLVKGEKTPHSMHCCHGETLILNLPSLVRRD